MINDEFLLGKKRADYSALLKYTSGSGIDGSAHSHFLSGETLVERQSLNEHVNKSDLAVVNFVNLVVNLENICGIFRTRPKIL